jgi:intracellular protease, PfpI family
MSENDLSVRNVLAIVTNYGVEQDELVLPVEHLRSWGAHVDVAATSADEIQTLVGDKDPGSTVRPDLTLNDVYEASYDLLLVPGGTLNADKLRMQDIATDIIRSFTSSGRPVAAICHGPWALVEADVVEGKELTSYASLKTDIANAGGEWADKPVVTDDSGGWILITSRKPGDLKHFIREIDSALAVKAPSAQPVDAPASA